MKDQMTHAEAVSVIVEQYEEIEALRKQLELMQKAPQWATYTKVCEQLAASQEALHAQQICHEHIVAEKDAEIERLKASCKHVGEANERLGIRVIEAERTAAASQLREQQLREALEEIAGLTDGEEWRIAKEAIDLPQDTSALETMIQKAGEVMRERCAKVAWNNESEIDGPTEMEIRALPGVTLEDLK